MDLALLIIEMVNEGHGPKRTLAFFDDTVVIYQELRRYPHLANFYGQKYNFKEISFYMKMGGFLEIEDATLLSSP